MNKFWSLAWRYGGNVNYLTNLLCLMILSGGSVHFPRPKRTKSAALSLSDDLPLRNSVTKVCSIIPTEKQVFRWPSLGFSTEQFRRLQSFFAQDPAPACCCCAHEMACRLRDEKGWKRLFLRKASACGAHEQSSH